jgi:hypothetical protein
LDPVEASDLDPLQRICVEFEDTLNFNTTQMAVIGGHLELERLREAIRRTVRELELCTSGVTDDGTRLRRGVWAPEDIPCAHHVFPGSISFANGALRRELMHLSQASPIRWRKGPPVQAFYLTDDSGARSALMTVCHHAIVDARAHELLLVRLTQAYAALGGARSPGGGSEMPDGYRYSPYREIEREARPRGEPGTTSARLRDSLHDLVTRGREGFRGRSPVADGAIDFVYHELDHATDALIRNLARRTGHTINDVITAALYRATERSRMTRSARVQIKCLVGLRSLIDARHRDNFQNLAVPCWLTLQSDYASDTHLVTAIAEQVAGLRRGGVFARVDRLERWLRVPAPIRNGLARLIEGRSPCYSNPGRVGDRLDSFGSDDRPILEYANFGCLNPPHDFVLYTPQFRGRLYFNVIYRTGACADVETDLLRPMRSALEAMAGSADGSRPH